jgi:hypothetical protein
VDGGPQGITPHILVWDKSGREDGTFSSNDFTFDRERNVYACPANKLLRTTGHRDNIYHYSITSSARPSISGGTVRPSAPKS